MHVNTMDHTRTCSKQSKLPYGTSSCPAYEKKQNIKQLVRILVYLVNIKTGDHSLFIWILSQSQISTIGTFCASSVEDCTDDKKSIPQHKLSESSAYSSRLVTTFPVLVVVNLFLFGILSDLSVNQVNSRHKQVQMQI